MARPGSIEQRILMKRRARRMGHPFESSPVAVTLYGGQTEPVLKADKGKMAGSCNRTACQEPGAVWWNRGSYAYYCYDCSRMLNRANQDFPEGDLCVLDVKALELFEKRQAA
jgi:hypothetical protein